MKKRIVSIVLVLCMFLSMMPIISFAAADIKTPTAMQIIPDKDCITTTENSSKNLYICNDANMVDRKGQLSFTVLNQNGTDITQYIKWSSDNVGAVRFDNPEKAEAVIPKPTSASVSTALITATFSKEGQQEFQVAYELTVVPHLNLTHESLAELKDYANGLVLKGDGTPVSWSMKSKLEPDIYRANDMLEMTTTGKASIPMPKSYWVDGSSAYPGISTATFTQKGSADNTVTLTVPVVGVAVENSAGKIGNTSVNINATEQLTAYTATADDNFAVYSGEDADVTWSSSNPDIATVNENGVVTGVSVGTAVITAQDNYVGTGQTKGYSGSITVNVKEKDKVYLDSAAIDYDNQNNIYTNPNLSSSSKVALSPYAVNGETILKKAVTYGPFDTQNDTLYLKATTSAVKYLNVAVAFDKENVKVEIFHNGTYVKDAENALATPIRPVTGDNKIVLRVSSIDGSGVAQEYNFNYFIEPSKLTTATVGTATLTSDDRAMSSIVKYNGNNEGKVFSVKNGSTVSPTLTSVPDWFACVFSDINTVNLNLLTADKAFGRIAYRMSADGPVVAEGVGSLTIDDLSFGNSDKIVLYINSCSAKAYDAAKAADTDPWSAPEKTYTLTIHRLDYALSDFDITSFNMGESGIASQTDFSASALTGMIYANSTSAQLNFTVKNNDYTLFKPSSATGSASASNTLTADSSGVYSSKIASPATDKSKLYTGYISIQTDGMYGKAIRRNYSISLLQPAVTDVSANVLPTGVSSYLCAPGKHTNDLPLTTSMAEMVTEPQANMLSQGYLPERTLFGWQPSTLSASDSYAGYNINYERNAVALGNYGGHITYYFEDGITNDANHPYGVDFVVYGYANGKLSAVNYEDDALRNAIVYVSENGEDWYELAGSEHYDSNAVWNYSVNYSKAEDGSANYSDNQGRGGNIGSDYKYPLATNYPLYNGDMTFSGTLLLGTNRLDNSLAGNALNAAWGYHGLKQNPDSFTTETPNPYAGTDNLGNGFDLSWAVDNNGLPVELDTVKYVKVVSANLLTGSKYDDKGAVVTGIVKTASASSDIQNPTDEAVKICVDGNEIMPTDTENVYTANPMNRNFTVTVSAPDGANVYINNQSGSERIYNNGEFDFDKGIVRVVIQSADNEPDIYYIKISDPVIAAREKAKEELASYKNPDDYRDAQKTELANAITAGNAAIDAAESVDAVNAALESAKAEIDKIKTDAQLTAEEQATKPSDDNNNTTKPSDNNSTTNSNNDNNQSATDQTNDNSDKSDSASNVNKNNSKTSPQTGADYTAVYVIILSAAFVLTVVTVISKKRKTRTND